MPAALGQTTARLAQHLQCAPATGSQRGQAPG